MTLHENITGNALALPEPATLATMFQSPDQIAGLISRIETEARQHVADISTKKGREAVASLAYKIARSKTALDDAGKDLNAEHRAKINAVDEERRKIRERLDALKTEVRKPLDEWEAAETARVDALKARVERLAKVEPAEPTVEAISALLARVVATMIDESWQEFLPQAAMAKDATLLRLRSQLQSAQTLEAERAELERLRAEAAARQQAEAAEAERRAAQEAEARQEAARQEAASRAAEAERAKIAAEKKAEADALAKRQADEAYTNRITGSIAIGLEAYVDAITALNIARAIMAGTIPHVKAVM